MHTKIRTVCVIHFNTCVDFDFAAVNVYALRKDLVNLWARVLSALEGTLRTYHSLISQSLRCTLCVLLRVYLTDRSNRKFSNPSVPGPKKVPQDF